MKPKRAAKSSEATRKLAKPAEKSSAPVITTRSWRDSQKVARSRLKRESNVAKTQNAKRVKSATESATSTEIESATEKNSDKSLQKVKKASEALMETSGGGTRDGKRDGTGTSIDELDVQGILSDEVRGILKDLNLDEHLPIAENGPERAAIPKTKRETAKKKTIPKNLRKKSPRNPPGFSAQDGKAEIGKKKHYNPEEVKRFMLRQKAERRKTEMRERDREREREAKIEQEMAKLRQRQAKMKKEQEGKMGRDRLARKTQDKAVDERETTGTHSFDPLQKAMEIIEELDQKKTRELEATQVHSILSNSIVLHAKAGNNTQKLKENRFVCFVQNRFLRPSFFRFQLFFGS